jgi:threonine dehydrogenase-like Zn-dependent dehydrogenase
MKTAYLIEPGVIDIRESEEIPLDDSKIRIQLQSCGVCQTDVKKFTGKSPAPFMPFVLGHEPAGVVAEIGMSAATNLKIGDRVAIAPVYTCGHCKACRSGLPYSQGMGMCENYDVLGYSINGAFAEELDVPPQFVHPIPDSLSFKDAALIEPIAACANGILRANPMPPAKVLVIGAGFMGLTCVQLAANLGHRVLASEPMDTRRDACKEMGASTTIDPASEDLVEIVKEETEGLGVDAVICSVGGQEITEQALQALTPGGTCVLLASALKGTLFRVDLNRLHYEQSVITGAVSYTGPSYQWAMDLLAQEKINTAALVSHEGRLEDVQNFMEMTRDLEGLKKVILN